MKNKPHVVTVGRLITYLKTLPQNTPIVLSRDSEGNGYSVLTDLGIAGLVEVSELELNMPLKTEKALLIYPD